MNSSQLFSAEQEFSIPPPRDLRAFPALRRSFRFPDRAKVLRDPTWKDRTSNGQPLDELRAWELPDSTPHIQLERSTKTFRFLLARQYRREAAVARAMAKEVRQSWAGLLHDGVLPSAVWSRIAVGDGHAEVLRELKARARWYEGRAGAQLPRFDTVRACCTRTIHVSCKLCAESLCEPIPCACGVVRICDDCADARAEKRQRGIAQARAAAILNGYDAGLFYRKRRGGMFSEKMLTLTVPHFTCADAEAFAPASELLEECGRDLDGFKFWNNDVSARVTALRLAWPKFMRSLRRWLKKVDPAGARSFRYYRLFEWTMGGDGKGHPHFHAYLFSPWLNVRLLRKWWAAALESVGVPLPSSCTACPDDGSECSYTGGHSRHVVIDIKRLAGFNYAALRELVKSGDRKAIETKLGELRAPGIDAVNYASAWTMSDAFAELPPEARAATADVQRDLYIAIEGRRLAQGSMGFSLALARPVCGCCGQSMFSAGVVDACATEGDAIEAPPVGRVRFLWEDRGPPGTQGVGDGQAFIDLRPVPEAAEADAGLVRGDDRQAGAGQAAFPFASAASTRAPRALRG
ncbi:MAG: hypothetical protein JWL95_3253 [Gemmatimonadetes bacterium]|nr:hypothetical protein [Gemmatimonadota bacterium]